MCSSFILGSLHYYIFHLPAYSASTALSLSWADLRRRRLPRPETRDLPSAPAHRHFSTMGGCASMPRKKAASAKSRPLDDQPYNVVMPEEEKNSEGGIHAEEPLVDLSEAKPEQEAVKETMAAEALVSELFDNAVVETTEAGHGKEVTMAEAVKEERKVEEEPVGKKQSGEIMQVDDDAAPRSSDAPLVTVMTV